MPIAASLVCIFSMWTCHRRPEAQEEVEQEPAWAQRAAQHAFYPIVYQGAPPTRAQALLLQAEAEDGYGVHGVFGLPTLR